LREEWKLVLRKISQLSDKEYYPQILQYLQLGVGNLNCRIVNIAG
jgi:hypothetical protein